MGKVNNKYGLVALSSVFALSMFGCTKVGSAAEMGRYIEEFYDAPEGIYDVRDLRVLSDGTIGMLAYGEKEIELYISDDECQNWNRKEINLPQGDSENSMLSVNNAILSKDGNIFISYYFYDYMKSEEDENLKEESVDDNAEDATDDKYFEPEYKYAFIDDEGSIHDISLDEISQNTVEDEDMSYSRYYYTFKFAKNGDIVFSNDNGMIYQLDPASGEIKNEFVLDDSYISDFTTVGDSLVIVGGNSVKEYSLESGKELGNIKPLESEVLYENNSNFYGISNIFSDDDKTIYYTSTTGLYKYKLGEKEVEQIIEGSLSSIGDDNMYISTFVVGKDNTFLACGQDYNSYEVGTSIIRFTYSADTPKVPENQITVYSLYENYQIRQNIVLYQKANPDIYIKLEIGTSGEDAVTESDALRTLNTEIMAGKGPDIILLDGMSEAYFEQGLLEDISDVIADYTKNDLLFENIIDAYTDKNGKVYSIPTKITIPVVVGKTEYVSSVTDLQTLSAALVKSAENSGKANDDKYVEMYTPSMLVSMLYYANGSTWLNEDNTINEDNIKEFLQETKNIYDAYLATYDEAQYEEYKESMQSYIDEYGEDIGIYYLDNYLNPMSIMNESSKKLAVGVISGRDFIEYMYSLSKGNQDISYALINGQTSGVFVPKNLMGINAKSDNKEMAKKFISYLLSEESQSKESYDGLPINKAAFDKISEYPYADEFVGENGEGYSEDQSIGTWGFSNENGTTVELKVYWPTKEYFNNFKAEIESLKSPVTVNTIVLEEVAKAFDKYANGNATLDEVVKNIGDNIDLILAE